MFTTRERTSSNGYEGPPLLFRGQHTGAVTLGDYPTEQVELGDALTPEILAEPEPQRW
ncbi:MAG: hypothetical protein ACYTAS_10640 [Planctomycetota bacterium]